MVQKVDYAQVEEKRIIEASLQRESTCVCWMRMPDSGSLVELAQIRGGGISPQFQLHLMNKGWFNEEPTLFLMLKFISIQYPKLPNTFRVFLLVVHHLHH